jgi:hypothetical protein
MPHTPAPPSALRPRVAPHRHARHPRAAALQAVCAGLVAFSGGVGAVRKPNAAKVDRYLEAGTLGK